MCLLDSDHPAVDRPAPSVVSVAGDKVSDLGVPLGKVRRCGCHASVRLRERHTILLPFSSPERARANQTTLLRMLRSHPAWGHLLSDSAKEQIRPPWSERQRSNNRSVNRTRNYANRAVAAPEKRKEQTRSVIAGFDDGWRVKLLVTLIFFVTGTGWAQQPKRTEHFVPVDQLDTVFEQSSGVLLPREQYRELVQQAQSLRQAASEAPSPILVRAATYRVVFADNHALVNVTLDLEQFVDHWQQIPVPAGNLRLENAILGGAPAVVGRESAHVLKLFHETTERFTVEFFFSTALGRVGSDRTVGFEIIRNTPVHLDVECPAGQHLLLDGHRLQRPQPVEQSATYSLPVGARDTVQLKWTSRRDSAVTDTLVFARSDVELRLSPDTLRWMAQTRIAVFGGQISRLSASVPATLEITAVESSGLESWELDDDPDRAGHIRVMLTWRQPFDADRVIKISGVAFVNDGEAGDIPTIVYNDITAHTGRLLITQENQLHLRATTGDGIRQLVPDGTQSSQTTTSIFDYWLQDYHLSVAVRPRDRELFSQITSQLRIVDTKATLTADVSIETLNAPLFETRLETPGEWQLLSVTDAAGQAVHWRASDNSSIITVQPAQPVPAGELLNLKLSLDRKIDDPTMRQQIALPVIRTPQASTVAGRYTISSAPDLQVALTEIHGLVSTSEDSGNIVFESQGTRVSGTLTVVRRPVRLSSRSEIRCWMDARQSTSTATVTIDVINGTTRTLQIRLPEQTGDDLRFDVVGIGQVPGYESASMSHLVPAQIEISEVKADEPVNGRRLWHLTFNRRFAGSVTLTTRVQQPREGNHLTALTVEVPGAIHQEGLIAFEASPDQQFDQTNEGAVRDLRPADPALVTAPAEGTGRRIARVYQFSRSSYAATLSETRYDIQVVPSAVCRTVQNTSLLRDTGSIQRSCRVDLHCIGVQTLRFTLPESEDTFLWSTVLNGDAVEVRRDKRDYLVAIPTGDDRTDHVLELMFESRAGSSSVFAATDHETVQFAIDVESGNAGPVDVMEQTWQVQYPADTLLLDHAGNFHPLGPLVRPGWLQTLSSELSLPSLVQIGVRGLVAGLVLGAMFLITALVIRRRWVVMGVVVVVGGIIAVRLSLFSLDQRSAVPVSESAASGSRSQSDASGFQMMLPGGSRDAGFTGAGGGSVDGLSRSLRRLEDSSGDVMPQVDAAAETTLQAVDGRLEESEEVQSAIAGQVPMRGTLGIDLEEQRARQRRGSARLSVRVRLEQPDDYQTTGFYSVGARAPSSRLSIVMRTADQIRMIRFLAVALALFACWMLRRRSIAIKVGAVASLGLLAIALVPLMPNQWQGLLDGIVLGSFLAILLWPGAALIDWIQNCKCCWRRTTVTGLLLWAMTTTATTGDDNNTEPPVTPSVKQPSSNIVLPYTPGEPPLAAKSVFVPREEFLRLYQQAHPGELRLETHPVDAIVTAAFYESGERQQVQGSKWTQSFHGRFVIHSFRDTPVQVTLPFRNVAIRTAALNEGAAIVIRDQTDFQVRVPDSGLHVLDVVFDVSAEIEASGGTVSLNLSEVPSGLLTFDLPAEDLNVQVNGRSDTYRVEGTTINIPLTSEKQIRIEWFPAIRRSSFNTIVHSTINSALEINNQGLTLVAVGMLNCRQGSITDTELTLPVGYSVRSVEGKNIAGWSVEGTNNAPRLKIVFRSEVTDQTILRLTLFSRKVITTERQSFPLPILEPLGVSRSTGTVCIIAGSELDVRTESLSGVSQINPSDAVLPAEDETPVSPILAWRFNRHPADVAIRASRVPDRLKASLLHGVQLESERQLWTSSFEVDIQGAARRRLEFHIPKTFLAFELDCTDLADWYVTESNDDAQDFKTLSVQLQTARTGRIRVVIQGQDEHSADRTSVRFVTPQLVGAHELRTQLSVWLGPATEISGFQGDGWTSTSTLQIAEQLQKLRPDAPNISFTSQTAQLTPIILSLRSALASVLCESVTVTNVTNTSIERTLALSWQISRSAADTFSVELPTSIAATLDFRIPGLRQEERTTLESDLVRITFHLQFPVSERFFASGAGAIPLPESSEFRNIPVTFVSSDSERSPISVASQTHFWVIVNQSDGVLEAVLPDVDTGDINPDQLQTLIPEGFLEQSAAIRRITAQQPGSIWRVRFPESQKTTPAVIALAQHVTVLADDGIWRSRHTLQVRNESRQFLPVQLPANSRPLFCMVKNKPTRIVTRSSDNGVLHLIPIPQSGKIIAPFEVQFAATGYLAGNTEAIRSRWIQESLKVPVPIFPEYRDNNDLGVTVARNTWSVFVPESWSSVVNDDPTLTNVLQADIASLEDTVVLSTIDNSKSMLRQATGTSLSSTKYQVFNELSSQLKILKTQRGNSREAETDLVETQKSIKRYLDENRQEQYRSRRIREMTDGTNNTNLVEQAQARNSFSNFNNDALREGNRGVIIWDSSSNQSRKRRESFNLRIEDDERSVGNDERKVKSESGAAGVKRRKPGGEIQRSQLLQKDIDSFENPASGRLNPRSRHDSKPVGKGESEELDLETGGDLFGGERQSSPAAVDRLQSPVPNQSGEGLDFNVMFRQDGLPGPQDTAGDGITQLAAPPVFTGLLSLRFDIPTDGQRLDFVRAGGNAALTLNVRSAESSDWLRGVLWAMGCCVGLLMGLRALKAGKLVSHVAVILTVVGIIGWFLLPTGLNLLSLILGIAGSIVLCGTKIKRSFRSAEQGV